MKKIYFEIIGSLIFIIFGYFVFGKELKNICNNELSFTFLSDLFYSNNHINEVVSSKSIYVYDYFIKDNELYICYANGEVVLPSGGICTKKDNNRITVEINNNIITIENFDEISVRIYEYFYGYQLLGKSNGYVCIKSNDISKIVSSLELLNEKA